MKFSKKKKKEKIGQYVIESFHWKKKVERYFHLLKMRGFGYSTRSFARYAVSKSIVSSSLFHLVCPRDPKIADCTSGH